MDYAVVIISAADGVEGHTETVWQLLKKHKVPTFFFLNKIDREGTIVADVIKEIRENLTEDVYDFTDSFAEGVMVEELIEFIAERDEDLFEHYMEKGYDKDLWLKKAKDMIQHHQLFACSAGSALHDKGVVEFLDLLDQLTETGYCNDSDFAARVYKIRHDENGNRITYLK
ncbi:hypothetical protein J4G37_46225, partial [Microvirga sp. 3-52]|nr:hypothetical protein [Microvirga sp. 3-52]